MYTRKSIDPLEYAGVVAKALDPGVLLTTRAGGRTNTMTIGWGTIGVEWGRPVFVAFVRTHRFTHQLLEESGEFTVNVPVGPFDRGILGLCGTRTGRDCDKLALAGLTAVPGQAVAAPAIAQLPLTLECRVIYRQHQDAAAIPPDILAKYHPRDVEPDFHGRNRDLHTAYYGEIVNAYILE